MSSIFFSPIGTFAHHQIPYSYSVVVIKNMFDPKYFDHDPTYLNDLRRYSTYVRKFGVL